MQFLRNATQKKQRNILDNTFCTKGEVLLSKHLDLKRKLKFTPTLQRKQEYCPNLLQEAPMKTFEKL